MAVITLNLPAFPIFYITVVTTMATRWIKYKRKFEIWDREYKLWGLWSYLWINICACSSSHRNPFVASQSIRRVVLSFVAWLPSCRIAFCHGVLFLTAWLLLPRSVFRRGVSFFIVWGYVSSSRITLRIRVRCSVLQFIAKMFMLFNMK